MIKKAQQKEKYTPAVTGQEAGHHSISGLTRRETGNHSHSHSLLTHTSLDAQTRGEQAFSEGMHLQLSLETRQHSPVYLLTKGLIIVMPTTKNMSTEKAIMVQPSRMARSSPTLAPGTCVRIPCSPCPSAPRLRSRSWATIVWQNSPGLTHTDTHTYRDLIQKWFKRKWFHVWLILHSLKQ